jgi:ribosomal protein S1
MKDDKNSVDNNVIDENDLLSESLLPDSGTYISPKKILEMEKDKEKPPIELYEHLVDTNTLIEVTVMGTKANGDLLVNLAQNLIGVIPNKEVYGKRYNPMKATYHLNKKYIVTVIGINKEDNTVKLSKDRSRAIYKEKLEKKLKVGDTVMAYINNVVDDKFKVYLDIENTGLLGYVRGFDWSSFYIQNPKEVIEPKTLVKVKITKIHKNEKGILYRCSRKALEKQNQWQLIESLFKKNDSVVVKATSVNIDTAFDVPHFLGEIPVLKKPEIQIKAYLHNTKLIKIQTGELYSVRILKIDKDKRAFTGRLLAPINEENNIVFDGENYNG